MTDAHAIDRAVSIACRRIFAQAWLTTTGWALLIGVGAAMMVLLIDRLLAIAMPWPVYAVIGGLALMAPIPLAWSRRPTPHHAAVLIDERLRLKDRLSTALYARDLPADDPFVPQVIHDAQAAAASVPVRDGFPVRLTRVWGWLPPAAAVVTLLAAFLSPMDLLGIGRSRLEQQMVQEQAAAAREQIVQAAAAIQQVQQDDAALEDVDPLSVMKEAASLTQRELTNPDYRQKAAAKLSAVEEKLATAEQQKAREFEALQNALSRLDPGQVPGGAADRFADALRRGDFEAAKAALQSLAENIDDLSPEQQDATRQQLENLAQQLDEAAKQAQQAQQQADERMRQQLSEAGLTQQQIDEAQKQNYDAQHLQQMLQRQGMSQPQAQQMARQAQQQQQQAQSQKECQGQCNGLSQSLQQMAQAMKQGQGQQGQQGQPSPGSGGAMESSSWQAQQQISEMGRMQQQLQQLRQSQQQTQQAMRQLQQGQEQAQQGQQAGKNQQPSPGGGVGGHKAGTADGGNPFGAERSYQPQQVDAYGNISEGDGRIIASWMQKGEAAPGEATVEFNAAVTQARDQAERAIADDRVPARYHEPVKRYFQQLPQSVDEVKKAPAAPR